MSNLQTQPVSIPTSSDSQSPILRGSGLKRSFKMGDSEITVLKHVDIAVKPGEFVAIEGRSGSGKSTLLHMLGALDEADAGTIEYNGQAINKLSGRERSRLRNTQFGFVFQFYHLLPELNVLENAELSSMIEHSWLSFKKNGKAIREKATQILTDLGMAHRLKHRPSQLSGGERQRVAIARALVGDRHLLLADEPTGALDSRTTEEIMELFLDLNASGMTVVMVTHEPDVAQYAKRIVRFRDGRILSDEPNPARRGKSVAVGS